MSFAIEAKMRVINAIKKHPEGISFNTLCTEVEKWVSRNYVGPILDELEKDELIIIPIKKTPKHLRRGRKIKIIATETLKRMDKELATLNRYSDNIILELSYLDCALNTKKGKEKDELVQDFLEKFPVGISVAFIMASTMAAKYPLPLKGLFFWVGNQIWQERSKELRTILSNNQKNLPSFLKHPNITLEIKTRPKLLDKIKKQEYLEWLKKERKLTFEQLKKIEDTLN